MIPASLRTQKSYSNHSRFSGRSADQKSSVDPLANLRIFFSLSQSTVSQNSQRIGMK